MDPVEGVSEEQNQEQSIDTIENDPEPPRQDENVAEEDRPISPDSAVINVEPHLESNLNVIENQNNENLERDQELRAEILNTANDVEDAVEAVESNNTINEPSQETVKEQEVENDINDEVIEAESVSDIKESEDDVSEPKECEDDLSEPKECEDDVSEPKESGEGISETKESIDGFTEPMEGNDHITEPKEVTDDVRETTESSDDLTEHAIENTTGEEASEEAQENEQNTSESNINYTVREVIEAEGEDPEEQKTQTEANREEIEPEAEVHDERIPSPVSKEDEPSTSEGKTSEGQKLIEESTSTVDEVSAEVKEVESGSQPSKASEEAETTDGNVAPEKKADIDEKSTENKDVEKDAAAATEEVSLDTSSKSTENTNISGNNNKNIEFAQVDFETDETEKAPGEPEKENDALTKSVELDPIASEMIADEFEPVDDREGADEELCIIPDTEREISQAEKDAASSLPPLKDISQASTVCSTSEQQEADIAESTDQIRVFNHDKDELQQCCECQLKRKVKFEFTDSNAKMNYICDKNCLDSFKKNSVKDVILASEESGGLRVKNFVQNSKEPPSLSFIRKCSSCKKIADDVETNLTWEIMDFCNEFCLSKYQREIGSKCSSCTGDVKSSSLGKYCVRFGNDIRQFCSSSCLEQYKKGLKVCSYCQQDMSSGPKGFLAPVGEKGQFKDFCSKLCMEKYDIMTNDRPPKVDRGTLCSVCKTEKLITIEFELDGANNYFCGEPCFVAFSFVNNISPGKCAMCRRHFNKCILEKHTMYYDNVQYSFCSNSCENIYIIAHRKIVPCSWCKVKKYNFDMIKKYSKSGLVVNMCSINCLSLYQVSLNAVHSKRITCNYCQKMAHPMYHLTMSDATIRNFCSYACVMSFQNQFPKQPITLSNLGDSNFPVPTGAPKRNKKYVPSINDTGPVSTDSSALPVIAKVQSLSSSNTNGLSSATVNPPGLTPITTSRLTRSAKATSPAPTPTPITSYSELPVQIQLKQHFIVRPMQQPEQRNVATMCSVRKAVKGVQIKPTMADMGMQTEKTIIEKILIPVPVPIYVPTPCHMFCSPVPIPVPFPVPVPIPIFIPTTRNSAAGIMKEIKKIQVKIPTDPYEAELLMMAEMVAEEKKEENTDSESDIDDAGDGGDYSPEPVDTNNTFGDDMLQMALKMATELDEPAVDLEGALTANTITAQQGGHQDAPEENVDDPQPMHTHMMERGRKRGMRGGQRGQSKRGRRMSHHQVEIPMMQVQQPPPPTEPQEKPDANMCLKYTFGVNAWKQWVTTKNTELEKSSRRVKLFKTEILQLTADELNYSLCLFVKEVRKPNGQEYAPDTIYYLCLGIQQYLFENGRIDNIFCDPYYEKFTDCLDEVAKKFSVLYNDSHYIVTRVEEEHLWESKQLGAHSPHVLLSTLMFFNTKHFNLTSVDEHMQLSFSHIMKHWKRNPNQPGASKVPGSRNVLLRFYPPQSALQHNQRKKKVYEQQENEENPLRCPVKLYEFYLSKCPESVKTRNDVFYLQPERSCVPDSPVWYSTMPLPKEALEKMLHRVKMVKEINVALLAS